MKQVLAATVAFASIAVATNSVRAQNLEAVVNRLADYWAGGDATSVAAMAARGGIRLNIEGKSVGPLAVRQATALLRDLFEERETINVRKMTPQIVGGQPPRAFGELSWMMRARGTTIPERTSVLISLVLEDGRWRVNEIRFVRP
jgi:hypothetical protein